MNTIMDKTYDWHFPLLRTHTGIPMGNGTLGALVWGKGSKICITMGRADLWDHRGGMPWTERMSYKNIRQCLEQKDEKALRAIFEKTAEKPGEPSRPSIVPVGRIDIELGHGITLEYGTLHLKDGSIVLHVRKNSRLVSLKILLDMDKPVIAIMFPPSLTDARIKTVPAWNFLSDELSRISFSPPTSFSSKGTKGWVQCLPEDPGVGVAYRHEKKSLFIAVERGLNEKDIKHISTKLVNQVAQDGIKTIQSNNDKWWKQYWHSVPYINIPNDRLSFLYYFGMYKFAGLTNPAGIPATLQGPWIEEYRMPPWSSDYHFNINVQMCYQPAYHGNLVHHLLPLFNLIFSWKEKLRHNAEIFLGIDDGAMLPHAVDDQCTCMGGFWTGSIDHGCTAWVALMMVRYYRFTMDRKFLKQAYPFMVATMRVYEEMIEPDGKKLALPVGVSPEYRGSAMNAWGKNASFQLACIHALAEALLDTSKTLRKKPKPIWQKIIDRLPKATIVEHKGVNMIGLWDGLVLEESHRHHAHLSAITPFDTIDPNDPEWHSIVKASLAQWIYQGPGLWSGWCMSWASTIHSHVGNAEAAELFLDVFDRFFTNEGYGTLHDADAAGVTNFGPNGIQERNPEENEVMQVDGAMGCVGAIQEMLLHTCRGITYIFKGVPRRWRNVSFDGIRTEGGFLISAKKTNGVIKKVTIKSSSSNATLKLANPWIGKVTLQIGKEQRTLSGPILKLRLPSGKRATLGQC